MVASQPTSAAAFGRLLWMMIGPVFLVLFAMFIVLRWAGWVTVADVLYFVALGAMVLGRWMEFKGGDPRTSTGEEAKEGYFSRYVAAVCFVGVSSWIIANALGKYFLSG